jgi:hypothetical protein
VEELFRRVEFGDTRHLVRLERREERLDRLQSPPRERFVCLAEGVVCFSQDQFGSIQLLQRVHHQSVRHEQEVEKRDAVAFSKFVLGPVQRRRSLCGPRWIDSAGLDGSIPRASRSDSSLPSLYRRDSIIVVNSRTGTIPSGGKRLSATMSGYCSSRYHRET